MQIAIFLILGWYIFVAGLLFRTWLRYAGMDVTMTPKQQLASWVMLLVATLFWGITLPLTYLELLQKHSTLSEKRVSEKRVSEKQVDDQAIVDQQGNINKQVGSNIL